MVRLTAVPHTMYTTYGDKFTIQNIDIKYTGNSGGRALYQVKMKINVERSTKTNNVYLTLKLYDRKANYLGYYNLIFGRDIGSYTTTVTWTDVDINSNTSFFFID